MEVRQVELEQRVNTLQSAQTKTTVQHNTTPSTRPGELEEERDIPALWTGVRQLQQDKEQEQKKAQRQEKNRALEEVRVLKEKVRKMTCDREQPFRELATPAEKSAEQPTSDPDLGLNITAGKINEEAQAQGISPPLRTPLSAS
jgi:hypothetical protein